MPVPYQLAASTPVAYGIDRIKAVADDVGRIAGRDATALLVIDHRLSQIGVGDKVTKVLEQGGFFVSVYSGVKGEPTAEQVDGAADAARRLHAKIVIGFGGGSALDMAKLAAVVSAGNESVEHYSLMANPLPQKVVPTICIPTTSGTGSEVTRTAIFTTKSGAKVWAWGDELKPKLAVLDPMLTVNLPPDLTAATGLDALVHAIEAFTNKRAHPLNDANALQAIALVARHLPTVIRDPGNVDARGAMQIAATLAGIAIDNGGTAVAHALGHAIGAVGHVHHGRAVALALMAALPGNIEASPARHVAVARAMGATEATDEELLRGLPEAYARLCNRVGLKLSLEDHGLKEESATRLLEEAMAPENRPMREANCREVDEAVMSDLIRSVLSLGS